ncbi:uncharacterized protein [Lepisosteus oculatus]|uniref:uncharacterized protein isoform X3 n=1 Tax=Lepisosteus oculatus TaxID=7918 RepID=UPI0035F51F13
MQQAVARPQRPQPSDVESARGVNRLWGYLQETGLQSGMEALCAEVLRRPQPPFNPYPVFMQWARWQAERIRLSQSDTEKKFREDVTFPTTLTAVRYIAGAKGCSHVWGLPSILRCVDPEKSKHFNWLIDDVTPSLSTLSHSSPYTIQVLAALTGLCVFTGTLFPRPFSLDILQIYVIAGPDAQRARVLYASCVRRDVIRTSQNGRHRLLRIIVPTDIKGGYKVFSKEEVASQGSEFEAVVERSLDTRLPVKVECVWREDPVGSSRQGGTKAYTLIAIQTADSFGEESRVLDFSDCPLVHLSSSLFPHQAHAEAYTRVFLPRGPHPPGPLTGGSAGTQGVFAPVRDCLIRRLAALRLPQDALPAAHLCVLLLLLPETAEPGPARGQAQDAPLETLGQMYQFLHGCAAHLWAVRHHARTLCGVLESQPWEAADAELCGALARRVRGLMLEFLSRAVQEGFSSDSLLHARILSGRLESVCLRLELGPSQAGLDELREWCSCSLVLECQLLSDSLSCLPVLADMKQKADRAAGQQPGDREPEDPKETPEMSLAFSRDLLYNMESCVDLSQGARGPLGGLELQASLSQYLVDCGVDRCWQRCLWTVLSASPLQPNPYPVLVDEFSRMALRVALWDRSDAQILKQVQPGSSRLTDRGQHLYCGPGGEGHGLESALRAAHLSQLQTVLGQALTLVCQARASGSFEVRTSLAVLSPVTWLGTLCPFLSSLEVTEFCYITSPPGGLTEVLQAYSRLVLSQLMELGQREALSPYEVRLSRGEVWSPRSVTSFPSAFCERFIEDLQDGHAVRLKEGSSAWLCFPKHDPLTIYHAVFQTQEQAAFHLRSVGPIGDPFSCANLQEVKSLLDSQIADSFLKRKLLLGYRLIALRALVTSEEGCLPSCWRMAHSMCGQLEYLCSIGQSLQYVFAPSTGSKKSNQRQTLSMHQEAAETMLRGYVWTVRQTLKHPGCLAPPELWKAVRPGKGGTNGEKTAWLKAILAVCGTLLNSLSRALHFLCPEVHNLLEKLDTERQWAVRAQVHSPKPAQPIPKICPNLSQPEQDTKQRAYLTAAQMLDSW